MVQGARGALKSLSSEGARDLDDGAGDARHDAINKGVRDNCYNAAAPPNAANLRVSTILDIPISHDYLQVRTTNTSVYLRDCHSVDAIVLFVVL